MVSSFLALNAKGGELVGSKQKDRTTTLFSKTVSQRGRNYSNYKNPLDRKSWKCFLKSYSYTIDYLQKNLKRLFQKICKNKQSGANVVQNVKLEESNHIYLEILSVGLNSR